MAAIGGEKRNQAAVGVWLMAVASWRKRSAVVMCNGSSGAQPWPENIRHQAIM